LGFPFFFTVEKWKVKGRGGKGEKKREKGGKGFPFDDYPTHLGGANSFSFLVFCSCCRKREKEKGKKKEKKERENNFRRPPL